MPPRFEDHIDHVDALVRAALDAADPAAALERAFETPGGVAQFTDPVRLVAAGKAAGPLARALVHGCGVEVVEGVCLGPEGQQWGGPGGSGGDTFECVRFFPVDHPVPTERNVAAAAACREVALAAAREGGTLVVLLSGGASAHLTLPAEELTLADMQAVTRALLQAGAPIEHLNCVRRHCEQLKGGGLLRLAREGIGSGSIGARTVTFALSDVIGDRPEAIGSGPTAADPTTYGDALEVLARYGAMEVSERVVRRLERGSLGAIPETLKPHDPVLNDAAYHIIASNESALRAAEAEAERLGFTVPACRGGVTGDAGEAGAALVQRAAAVRERGAGMFLVLAGGETTVRVAGEGEGVPRGGRNLHAALSMAVGLEAGAAAFAGAGLAAFSVATDGVDGSSDAAGAIVSAGTCARARRLGVDPATALARRESHAFFEKVGGFIRTGPTGTNVNDVAGVLVY